MNPYSIMRRRDFLKNAAMEICGLFAVDVSGFWLKDALGKIANLVRADASLSNGTNIPERVAQEIRKARDILLQDNPELFFTNGYVASALYYSDQFLQQELGLGETEDNVSQQIIGGIKDLVAPQKRKQYVAFLRERYSNAHPFSTQNMRLRLPLKKIDWGSLRKGESHLYAVDLFIPEGSEVFSMSNGVVALAENGWQKDDPFSTSSFAGGNTIIIFHPHKNEFYRYCHLARALPDTGKAVSAGDVIGIVGHTGKNASLSGHGNHLHLEIHRVNNAGNVISFSSQEIRQRIMGVGHPHKK